MRTFSGIAPVLAVFVGVMYIGLAGSHAGRSATIMKGVFRGDDSPRSRSVAAGGIDPMSKGIGAGRLWWISLSRKTMPGTSFLTTWGLTQAIRNTGRGGLGCLQGRCRASSGSFLRPRGFATDDRTRARVAHRDYTGTGYDRGHMAPNHAIASRYGRRLSRRSDEQRHSPEAGAEQGNLAKTGRDGSRKWSQKLEEVWVITGPVFDDERTYHGNGEAGIDIPDAFFKVVIDEAPFDSRMTVHEYSDRAVAPKRGIRPWHRPRVLAFIVPQDVDGSEPLTEFLVSVDWIEQKTGLDLMPEVPDDVEEAIESEIADQLW